MAKKREEPTPEFEAVMARIHAVTETRTQVQLAGVLDVRQSSISDAKRRASIPDGWLVKLLRTHLVLPDWILTGKGPQYLNNANHTAVAQLQEQLAQATADLTALAARVEQSLDIITLTDAELARRKAKQAVILAEDLVGAEGIRASLENMTATVAGLNH